MDVVVIGGGIVGLSAAYYLAGRGASVTLYERGSLGNGSTARAAGGIRSQFSTKVNVELSLASKVVWNASEETFGVDIGLRKNGYLVSRANRVDSRTVSRKRSHATRLWGGERVSHADGGGRTLSRTGPGAVRRRDLQP